MQSCLDDSTKTAYVIKKTITENKRLLYLARVHESHLSVDNSILHVDICYRQQQWSLIKATRLICFRITKTCLYKFDPLKPHFYIVKLGFAGVYIIFLIFAKIHLRFEQKYEKISEFFLSENVLFLEVKFYISYIYIYIYINILVFIFQKVMICPRFTLKM